MSFKEWLKAVEELLRHTGRGDAEYLRVQRKSLRTLHNRGYSPVSAVGLLLKRAELRSQFIEAPYWGGRP